MFFQYLEIRQIGGKRGILAKFIKAGIAALVAVGVVFWPLYCINFSMAVDIEDVFSSFVTSQISAIAIILSFSLAIISILASSDSPRIEKLEQKNKMLPGDNQAMYRELKGWEKVDYTYFQALLATIIYNVVIKIIYLIFLIICVFLQLYIFSEIFYVILMAVSVAFIFHILDILLEALMIIHCNLWKTS
jgi:hypothetical protein